MNGTDARVRHGSRLLILAAFALAWVGCEFARAQPCDVQASVIASQREAEAACVRVWLPLDGGSVMADGTGVVVEWGGVKYVCTNWHVVTDARSSGPPQISFDCEHWTRVRILASEELADVAVLTADQSWPAVKVAEFSDAGEYCGYGFAGEDHLHFHRFRPVGAIQWGSRPITEFDEPNCSGDSGGPIFDANWNVVGVMRGKWEDVTRGVVGQPFQEFLAKASEAIE